MGAVRFFSALSGNLPVGGTAFISTGALENNYRTIMSAVKAASPKCESICVVKADAYGHTTEICAQVLAAAGCRRFAVANIAEACALHKTLSDASVEDFSVLILGRTDCEYAHLLTQYSFIQCVYSFEYAKELSSAANGEIEVHIKVDTGMNRLGFSVKHEADVERVADEIVQISRFENLEISGLFTHFARADERTPEGDVATREQFSLFESLDTALSKRGIEGLFKHCCNSAAALYYPEFSCDGVRLGISLYGAGECAELLLGIRPVMRFESRITHIHESFAGERIGYGGDFICDKAMRIATVSVGYADGFSRDYRNGSVGIVRGGVSFEARVVGRICMDQFMIDVSDIPASVGDRVVIFGDCHERIRKLAKSAGTIDYECLCAVSARVPRIAE